MKTSNTISSSCFCFVRGTTWGALKNRDVFVSITDNSNVSLHDDVIEYQKSSSKGKLA